MPQHNLGFLCVVSQRDFTQSWPLLCKLGLQDKSMGWSAGPYWKSGHPSSHHSRFWSHAVTELLSCKSQLASALPTSSVQVKQTCWVIWQGDPTALGQNSPYGPVPPCLSAMPCVCTLPQPERWLDSTLLFQQKNSCHKNNLEKGGNLFSTWCVVVAFLGEASGVVPIITAQSPSSGACCQCWLNSGFSESRSEVLTFKGFQISNWQSNSQNRNGRRPQAAQLMPHLMPVSDILTRQILTYQGKY